jgi:hypothetical protein
MERDSTGRPASSDAFSRLALAMVLGVYLYLLTAPGTTDVTDYWLRWIGLMREHGLVEGYRLASSDYTPLSFIILYVMARTADALHASTFLLLKIGITAFALSGALVFWWWSRNLWRTTAFLLAIMLNSVAQGYLDALYLPPLLLALIALQRRSLTIAGLFLSVAVAVKWQPLMIAPFFVLEACRSPSGPTAGTRRLALDRTVLPAIGRLSLGALPVVVLGAGAFGGGALAASFKQAMSHVALSYQALNLNWIIQLVTYDVRGLSDLPYFQMRPPATLVWLAKAVFATAYGFLVIAFWRSARTFADFLWYASVGALAYFTLNTGVHENHLFLAMVLAFALCCVESSLALPMATLTTMAANINLLLFYGLDGRTVFQTPLFDAVTVLFSALNTAFIALCLWQVRARWRATSR